MVHGFYRVTGVLGIGHRAIEAGRRVAAYQVVLALQYPARFSHVLLDGLGLVGKHQAGFHRQAIARKGVIHTGLVDLIGAWVRVTVVLPDTCVGKGDIGIVVIVAGYVVANFKGKRQR